MDTWPTRPEHELPVAPVLDWIEALDGPLDGVTISGGEPTDQPAELRELLEGIRELQRARHATWDVLVYSGRAAPVVTVRFPWLFELVDMVITGPFVEHRPTNDHLMGSANQERIITSALGEERYGTATTLPGRRRFDVVVADGTVWLAGIPRRGDMEELERKLETRGVMIESPSWLV